MDDDKTKIIKILEDVVFQELKRRKISVSLENHDDSQEVETIVQSLIPQIKAEWDAIFSQAPLGEETVPYAQSELAIRKVILRLDPLAYDGEEGEPPDYQNYAVNGNPSEWPDEIMVAAIVQNHPEWMTEFQRRFHSSLEKWIRHYFYEHPQDHEDLVMDVMLTASRRLARWNQTAPLGAYAHLVIRSVAGALLEKRKRYQQHHSSIEGHEGESDQRTADRLNADQGYFETLEEDFDYPDYRLEDCAMVMAECLKELSEEQKQLLQWYLDCGGSMQMVAKNLEQRKRMITGVFAECYEITQRQWKKWRKHPLLQSVVDDLDPLKQQVYLGKTAFQTKLKNAGLNFQQIEVVLADSDLKRVMNKKELEYFLDEGMERVMQRFKWYYPAVTPKEDDYKKLILKATQVVLPRAALTPLGKVVPNNIITALEPLVDQTFSSEYKFLKAVTDTLGKDADPWKAELLTHVVREGDILPKMHPVSLVVALLGGMS